MSARAAALERWANTSAADRAKFMADARARLMTRWEKKVDPDGVLPIAERRRRAKALEKAHMVRMGLAASKKRAAQKQQP